MQFFPSIFFIKHKRYPKHHSGKKKPNYVSTPNYYPKHPNIIILRSIYLLSLKQFFFSFSSYSLRHHIWSLGLNFFYPFDQFHQVLTNTVWRNINKNKKNDETNLDVTKHHQISSKVVYVSSNWHYLWESKKI